MAETPVGASSPVRRARGRASDSAATRQLIIDIAAREFSERGYMATSLNDIVAGTGMTKGALYWHFESKESVAVAVVHQMFETWPVMLRGVIDSHDDALSALVAVTYVAGEQFARDPVVRASKRLMSELPPDALAKLPQPYVGWQHALAQLITQGQQRGQINAAADPVGTAQVIVASFFGMQQVSQELSARRDLAGRLDSFWALVLPQLQPASPA
ncbi:ScbR family autoregulator-binding transcription factor [Blastococcus sp. VKM Ac-2987]|uniref:ScbR family autoregulator-binding transcription factor n=1 Tax=Blastococcus sp. VKM Ac-2987 TaxID=3004141 RepID=UPI0022AB5189|nr:ScbR family autoregulator-binding transcription factor [Blastococcus sp. VKM Ac-2987]MCZ2858147.1 ScbR family autoregulator-binding transcription factor [Blastococcus sp. VKM Ac-2987]